MLVMSPSEVTTALGANCGGGAVEDLDQTMVRILRLITPRLEGALNVESLTRQPFTDFFYLSAMPRGCDPAQSELRLSNGFLVPGTISIIDPNGATVLSGTDADDVCDMQKGVVNLSSWQRGNYRVAYQSGFVPGDDPDPKPDWFVEEDKVLQDVPDWMKGIVVHLVSIWYRSVPAQIKAPKDISYAAVDQSLRRELYARVYEKYMRPRVGVIFSDKLIYG